MIPNIKTTMSLGALRRLLSRWRAIATTEGGFARSVALLSSGTAIALGVSLLLSPVITRLYSPGLIGQLGLFTSFLTVAAVAVSLRYELGVIAAKDEADAARLVFLTVLFSLPMSLLLSGLLHLLIRFSILGFGALPRYAPLLMFAVLLLTGTFGALRFWEISAERFGTISKAAVAQHAVRSLSQVIFGLFYSSSAGLLFGELLGRCGGLSAMFREAFPRVKPHVLRSTLHEFRKTLKDNRKFPLYSLPSELIDTAAANMFVPLLVLLYGTETGGYFALVQRVMAVPVYLVATNVADVFHSRFALYARNQPEQCGWLFRRTGLTLAVMGAVPAAILMIFGKPLFVLIFGKRWLLAGVMAGLVAPWFLAQFVLNPLSRVVLVLHGQEFKLVYDFFKLGSVVALFWIARHHGFTALQTVSWLSWVNVIGYGVYFLVLRYVMRKKIRPTTTTTDDASDANRWAAPVATGSE
jgi:O-antigen/teichoic acid export membrane protein